MLRLIALALTADSREQSLDPLQPLVQFVNVLAEFSNSMV
jgi:hypothetical protein